MMIWGDKLYGKIYQVPGVCYVATVFFHFWFLPIWPMRSYIVFEGEEYRTGDPEEYGRVKVTAYGFPGVRIPMSFRSVFMGYFRGFLGLLTVGMSVSLFKSYEAPARQRFTDEERLTYAAFIVVCPTLIWLSRWLTVASQSKAAELTAMLCAVEVEDATESDNSKHRTKPRRWRRDER